MADPQGVQQGLDQAKSMFQGMTKALTKTVSEAVETAKANPNVALALEKTQQGVSQVSKQVGKVVTQVQNNEQVQKTVQQAQTMAMQGAQKVMELDQQHHVSEKVTSGLTRGISQVKSMVSGDKKLKIDNLLGIQSHYDAFFTKFMSAKEKSREEELESKQEVADGDGDDGALAPPPLRRVGSDPNSDSRTMYDDDNPNIVTLTSRGWSQGFFLERSHVQHEVVQLFDKFDGINEVDSNELMTIFDNAGVTTEDLDMWVGYEERGKVFHSLSAARSRLQTVVNYCTGSQCTDQCKKKLKFITKEFLDKPDQYEPTGILLLLASHGNVCNVMKEVGVDSAYSAVTGQAKEMFAKQTLEERVFGLLQEFRAMLIEELYGSFGAVNNTHSIMLMHNELAEKIGIPKVLDKQSSVWGLPSNWKDGLEEKYWNNHYTVNKITRWMFLAINEEPRKLPYELIVKFFEENSPVEDAYLFLSDVFNVELGILKTRYICWMLYKIGVFSVPEDIVFEIPEMDQSVELDMNLLDEPPSMKKQGSVEFEDTQHSVVSYGANAFTNLFGKARQGLNIFFAPPQVGHLEEGETDNTELESAPKCKTCSQNMEQMNQEELVEEHRGYSHGYTCDLCDKSSKKWPVWHCAACQADYCEECASLIY